MEKTCANLELKGTLIEKEFVLHFDRILGSGWSGDIRYCTEISTGKQFALKILLDNPRSRQEASIHQQLSGHPHIVTLHSVYHNSLKLKEDATPRPRLFLVMELMNGGNMFDWWDGRQTDEATTTKFMNQMVDALKYVHGQGIAHRDIKPENFLFSDDTEDAIVKLADFGFATEDIYGLTLPYFSRYYVAPEVLRQSNLNGKRENYKPESHYDKSCDMWSLGVIMYCMLCNYPPFFNDEDDENCDSLFKRILDGDYEFPSQEWDAISETAKDIVRRLLQVDPRQRMTVQELADHSWLKGTCSTGMATSSASPSSPIIVCNEDSVSEIKPSSKVLCRQSELVNNFHHLNDAGATLKHLDDANTPLQRKRKRRYSFPNEDSKENATLPTKKTRS